MANTQMRATVNRKQLLELLGKVKMALPKKYCSIPVCATVLLTAKERGLTATTTDLEVRLSGRVDAKVTRAGGFCASPSSLESFLKTVADEWVTLMVTGASKLRIEVGSSSIELDGHKAEDFPPTPKIKAKVTELYGLATALHKIEFAVSRDDTRPVLMGICFSPLNDGHIELAAADGFRLAIARAMVKGTAPTKAIIPLRAILLIEKLMPHMLVNMRQSEKEVSFEGDGLILITAPIKGSFPNYQHLIPKGGTALHFDRGEMFKALKVVESINQSAGVVRLWTKGNSLILSTKEEEHGTVETKIPAKGKAKIAFTLKYLRELLNLVDGEVTMRTKSPSDPAVIEYAGVTYVMMPMFVQW